MRHPSARDRGVRRTLLGGVAALCAVAVAGCGTTTATVIGARAVPTTTPASGTSADGVVGAIQHKLANDLAQASSAVDAKLPPLSPQDPESLALQNVMAAQRLSSLGKLGVSLIDNRASTVAGLRTTILGLHTLSDAQRQPFLALVDQAAAGLAALRAKILADGQPDVLRNDVRSIATLHVLGFVAPVVHFASACDGFLSAGPGMIALASTLDGRVNLAGGLLADPAHDTALLTDLRSHIATMTQISLTTLASLAGLSVAGYPSNQPALTAAQASLQSALQNLVTARGDASTVLTDLGG